MFDIAWFHSTPEVRKKAIWALSTQPLAPRDGFRGLSGLTQDQVNDAISAFESADDPKKIAILIIAWYKRAAWTDDELAEKAKPIMRRSMRGERTKGTYFELCRRLGIAEAAGAD